MNEIEMNEYREGTGDLTKSHLHVQLQDDGMLPRKELLEWNTSTAVLKEF